MIEKNLRAMFERDTTFISSVENKEDENNDKLHLEVYVYIYID